MQAAAVVDTTFDHDRWTASLGKPREIACAAARTSSGLRAGARR
jgi:hypothetical protein